MVPELVGSVKRMRFFEMGGGGESVKSYASDSREQKNYKREETTLLTAIHKIPGLRFSCIACIACHIILRLVGQYTFAFRSSHFAVSRFFDTFYIPSRKLRKGCIAGLHRRMVNDFLRPTKRHDFLFGGKGYKGTGRHWDGSTKGVQTSTIWRDCKPHIM